MATNLALASIKSTGSTTSRTFGARFADIINVKDYGATGDGSTDDTAAIQAAFDAAFGTVGSPHGQSNAGLNKQVFFPGGNYKITSTLNLRSVMGGHIFGNGIGSTILTWLGSSPGGGTLTSMVYINGMNGGSIENMSFIMQGVGAAVSTYNSVCINWDWDNTGSVNGSGTTFNNLAFSNTTYGILVGNSGYECDAALFTNCTFGNIWYGIKTCNGNALNHTVIGGGTSGCFGATYWASNGSFNAIINSSLSAGNNAAAYDIASDGGGSISVIGCRSESPNFVRNSGTTTVAQIKNCVHDSPYTGHFCHGEGSTHIDSCYSLNGDLSGSNNKGQYFLDNCEFVRYDFYSTSGAAQSNVIEINNTFVGYASSIGRKVVNQRYTAAQGVRNYKIEASSLSDPQFLYDSYCGLGAPTIAAQGGYVTITIASPAVLSLVGIANNQLNFQAGIAVAFTTSGALPTGLSVGTVYFISNDNLTQTTFRLADTLAHALAGTNSINTSGSQSGNQTMYFVRTYSVGDFVANNTVAAGGSPGWYCTTAGLAVGVAVFKAAANVAA